jgi:hypothetical protein
MLRLLTDSGILIFHMKKFYSGIGSRETPDTVCNFMTVIASELEERDYILRSGGADGADSAFERGVKLHKEIWIPWLGFNNNKSPLLPISAAAYDIAATVHPVWSRLKPAVKSLHARNCHQILGADLNTKSSFVLCWTEGAEIKGGTATAIKLALYNSIPVLNFGKWVSVASMRDAFEDFLILNGEYNDL